MAHDSQHQTLLYKIALLPRRLLVLILVFCCLVEDRSVPEADVLNPFWWVAQVGTTFEVFQRKDDAIAWVARLSYEWQKQAVIWHL